MFELRLSRLRLSEHSRAPGNELPWIRASYDTFQGFVSQTASNLSESAIFLRTVIELPLEATVRLDVGMQNGPVLIRAVGEIAQVTPGTDRDRNPGLLVSFLYLDPASARLIESIRRRRRELEAASPAPAPEEPVDVGLTTRPMAAIPAAGTAEPTAEAGTPEVDAAQVDAAEAERRELRESLSTDSETGWEVEVESLLSQVAPTAEEAAVPSAVDRGDLPSPFDDATVEPDEAAVEEEALEPVEVAPAAREAPTEADADGDGAGVGAEETTGVEIEGVIGFDELETWPPPGAEAPADRAEPNELETLAVPFVEPTPPADEEGVEGMAEAAAAVDGASEPDLVGDDEAEPPAELLPELSLEELDGSAGEGPVVDGEPEEPTVDERPEVAAADEPARPVAPEPTWGTQDPGAPAPSPPPYAEPSAKPGSLDERIEAIRRRRAALDRPPPPMAGSVAMSAKPTRTRRPLVVAALVFAALLAVGLGLVWRGDLDGIRPFAGARHSPPAAEDVRGPDGPTAEAASPPSAAAGGAQAVEPTPATVEPATAVGPAAAAAGDPPTASGEAATPPDAGTAAPAPPAGDATEAPSTAAAAVQVEAAVRAWAAAWSQQDADRYLASYARDYAPPGRSRAGWEAERRTRVQAPRRIEVGLSELEVELASSDRALARFVQLYRTERVNLRTRKTLEMVREAGGWKIAGERREP